MKCISYKVYYYFFYFQFPPTLFIILFIVYNISVEVNKTLIKIVLIINSSPLVSFWFTRDIPTRLRCWLLDCFRLIRFRYTSDYLYISYIVSFSLHSSVLSLVSWCFMSHSDTVAFRSVLNPSVLSHLSNSFIGWGDAYRS